MRLLRNPMVQFLVASFLLFGATWWATGMLSERAGRSEAVADAQVTTELLAHSVAEPAIPRKLVATDPGAIDRFDRAVLSRLMVGDVRRIKIWRADGTIVYSDETDLIGQRFPLDDEQRQVLLSGHTEGGVSDLRRSENKFETDQSGLLEVYTQIHSPEGTPLLFEAYYSLTTVQQRAHEVLTPFRRITAGGLLAILLLGVPLIGALTLRLTRASKARERLMLRAIDSSEAERRRIARDLHDGVVQELAGTAFALSGSAREPGLSAELRGDLDRAGQAVRRSLRQLRSLLVEIHPPGLNAGSLAASLEDLTAPAVSAGTAATVSVSGIEGAPDHVVTLVWRAAQESIRNAVRHAHAEHLSVDVTGDERQVRLVVKDDGVGFDPAQRSADTSYGLRGLKSLVEDGGGVVDVDSSPDAGTTVRMVVDRR
ncbi:sensor histidine kinase [Nocardioides cynanchi]|uniref:sensor histidine kinase n=1 Tax=Nocardioides cynanchi TaxID=2558918 RepID=UPI0012463E8D|nr:sensor histidine kinase [Nocardioides cynanchi]